MASKRKHGSKERKPAQKRYVQEHRLQKNKKRNIEKNEKRRRTTDE